MKLYNDIYNCIGEYLYIIERYKLTLICKESKQIFDIDKEFKKQITKKMGEFIGDSRDFCRELKKNKCVISGSYILDCLYGTNYANDIDIIKKIEVKDEDDEWFHQNNCHTGYSYDKDNGNIIIDEFIEYLYRIKAKEIYNTEKQKLTRCILLNVRNYKINGKKIQFIMINQDIKNI